MEAAAVRATSARGAVIKNLRRYLNLSHLIMTTAAARPAL
jgi:hypothetical protein